MVGPACWPLEAVGTLGGAEPADARYFTPSLRYIAGPVPAAGCVAIATPGGGIQGPPAYILQRFGVVLAENAVARQVWPNLPAASPQEERLAASWIALAPVTAG